MADNVFKFRTLKWGDPDPRYRLRMGVPTDDHPRRALPWIEIGLSAFIVASLTVIAWHLM